MGITCSGKKQAEPSLTAVAGSPAQQRFGFSRHTQGVECSRYARRRVLPCLAAPTAYGMLAGHPSTCSRLLRKLDDRNKISQRGLMHSGVPYHATGIANVELVNVTQHKLQLSGNGSEVEPAPPAEAPFVPW